MKLQIIVHTPSVFLKAKVQEVPQEQHDGLLELIKRTDLDYFTFNDETGSAVLLPKDVIKNSIFQLKIVD